MQTTVIYLALAMTVVTFFAFGLDKRRARLGRRRTPERTLLLLAWCTGFVGAWVGMTVFRHKSRKTGFKVRLLLLTLFNLLWGLVWLALQLEK